jgi:hypothetical protein
MAYRLSTGLQNAALDGGIGPAFDGGTARINVYTGTQPASANNAASGTLLGTLTPASDVFGAGSSGTITAAAITADSAADASGTPGWARVYRTGDTAPGSAAGTSDRRLDMACGFRTQLNGAITNAVTTLTVDSTAGFPSSGTLICESEQITYTGKTSTTFTGCTRGANSTAAAAHADNVEIKTANVELTFDNANFVSDGFVAGGQISMSSWTITQPSGE